MKAQIYYRKGYKYQLASDYRILTAIKGYNVHTDYLQLTPDGLLVIKKGYAWDGPSGPTLDTKSSMRGSLVHDGLYQLMRMGLLPESCRERADDLLHEICTEDGMIPARADIWEIMVRLFAKKCAKYGTDREILTAP